MKATTLAIQDCLDEGCSVEAGETCAACQRRSEDDDILCCWQALMDLDQKLARDEAKIKAQKHAVMRYCFFLGSCVANDESVFVS